MSPEIEIQSTHTRRAKERDLVTVRRVLFVSLLGCISLNAATKADDEPIRYVAIGDSYSIGEGAAADQSWPSILAQHLTERGLPIRLVANPSRTGWTTQNAIDRELPILLRSKPDFVTLQIGVNDWVQGVNEKTFRKRFILLVDRMREALSDKSRFLILTIPDFGVTPTGGRYGRGRNISEGLLRFNQIIREEAERRHLRVVDVFLLSKSMSADHSLVANDGLHPSAKEYAEWEKLIFPAALELLSGKTDSPNR